MKNLLIFIIILIVSFLLFQGCVKKLMDNVTFQVTPSHVFPSSIGLRYNEINIIHDERTARAWFIKSGNDKQVNNVVTLFNGIGGNLSGWRYFQKCLAASGISSVCFEYGPLTDTLNDKGSSRLKNVTNDVKVIIDTLTQIYGKTLNLFLLGHSGGNAVMLEMYPNIDKTAIKGIIVCNAFSSMKNWGIEHGKIPRIFSFVFPNYYDNVSNIKKVKQPVLILHSKSDSINFIRGGTAIFNAAGQNKQFIQFENFRHNDIFKEGNFEYWIPIIQFIKSNSSH